jgi:hypothetical protein
MQQLEESLADDAPRPRAMQPEAEDAGGGHPGDASGAGPADDPASAFLAQVRGSGRRPARGGDDGRRGRRRRERARQAEMGELLDSLEAEVDRARDDGRRGRSVLPRFLVPEHRPHAQVRLEQLNQGRAAAVSNAYERHQRALEDERRRLERRNEEIARRRKRSENAHRSKMKIAMRKKEANRDFIIAQATEKRRLDAQQAESRRFLTDPDPARCMPMAVAATEKERRNAAKVQRNLRRALDKQVRDKQRAARVKREEDVAEQRYFLNCVHEQLVNDRAARRQRTVATQQALRQEWEQQRMLDRVKNDLHRSEY